MVLGLPKNLHVFFFFKILVYKADTVTLAPYLRLLGLILHPQGPFHSQSYSEP